jgi:predicted transport protein
MSDIKLFNISNGSAQELQGTSIAIEKTLKTLIENHLEVFLGVRFLASEHSTGKTHGGRIDTLGLDENGSPVIIEYKRALNENVINQGLFYLDWLMDHKGEFELLVLKKLGKEAAEAIEWSVPRLLCIASDFTKYDEHAVQQINRNIELIRYRRYGGELLLFELVNATTAQVQTEISTAVSTNGSKQKSIVNYKTATELLEQASPNLRDRFEALKAFLTALGDDVQLKTLKYYFAFRRIKNFACVEVHPQSMRLLLYVKVDPSTIQLEKGFTRDVHSIGHYGTGDLEIIIQSDEDLERAKPFVLKSYEVN